MSMKYLSVFLLIATVWLMAACGGGGGGSDTENTTIINVVADAGKNNYATTGTSVQVNGADSIETTQNKALNYLWSIADKPPGSNASPPMPNDAVNPRFKPDIDGDYKLQLDVSVPDSNAKETSYVTIVANGTQRGPSVAVDAGKDQFVANNSNVQINQGNGTVYNGNVTFIWQVVNTPNETVKQTITQQIEQTQPTSGANTVDLSLSL